MLAPCAPALRPAQLGRRKCTRSGDLERRGIQTRRGSGRSGSCEAGARRRLRCPWCLVDGRRARGSWVGDAGCPGGVGWRSSKGGRCLYVEFAAMRCARARMSSMLQGIPCIRTARAHRRRKAAEGSGCGFQWGHADRWRWAKFSGNRRPRTAIRLPLAPHRTVTRRERTE